MVAVGLAVVQFIVWLSQAAGVKKAVHHMPNAPRLVNLVSLHTYGEDRSMWKILRFVLIFLSSLVLALVAAVIVMLATSRIVLGPIPQMFVIYLCISLAIPIFLLVDTIKVQRRVRRGWPSRVYKRAECECIGDYRSLFLRCQQVISDMGGRFTGLDFDSGLISANLTSGSTLNISIMSLDNGRHRLSVISDSTLPSVRFDFGKNLKNIDEFMKGVLGLS